MFENIMNFFKNVGKKEEKKKTQENSKDAAKERLHLVLMQDRANVSADFLELMKQEIIDVIKKYIEIDEKEIDVRLTNKENEDGTNGAPALYANIPILNIKNDTRKITNINKKNVEEKQGKEEQNKEEKGNIETKEKNNNTEKAQNKSNTESKEQKTKRIEKSKVQKEEKEETDKNQKDDNEAKIEKDDNKEEERILKEEIKSEN